MNSPESPTIAPNSPENLPPPPKPRRLGGLVLALLIGLLLGVLIDRVIALNAGPNGIAIIAIALGLAGLAYGISAFINNSRAPHHEANQPITPAPAVAPNAAQPTLFGDVPALAVASVPAGTFTSVAEINQSTIKIHVPAPAKISTWFTSRGPLTLTPSTALMFGAGLCLAVGGQLLISAESLSLGIAMFVVAALCALIALGGSATSPNPDGFLAGVADTHGLSAEWQLRLGALALLCGAGAFAFSSGNLYTGIGVALWVLSIVIWLPSMANYKRGLTERLQSWPGFGTLKPAQWAAAILLIVTLIIGFGFRFYNLRNNPRDMNSDHTEKLLDVNDILQGTYHIFMERNTGREPWQFYWTVALSKLLNIPADFNALKIGTALIGCLMLPAIFLFARELFGWRVGLIALLFAGVTSWVVLAQRFGLRHGLNPAMVAWTMFFLARGLRRGSRNAMLASGVAMGIGLQGYTPFRFMPIVYFVVVAGWVLWQLRKGNRAAFPWAFKHLILAVITALLVIMPLFRYALESPDELFYRTASRLGTAEKEIDGKPSEIILDNIKRAVLAFNYTTDEVWVANLSDRPALDQILGGLLVIGAVMAIGLSVKRRDPWPILLLFTAFLMLMPSALNVAFPRENPSMLRIGGAMPMLMTLCALVPGLLWEWASQQKANTRQGQMALLGGALSGVLCIGAIGTNYNRVFVEYPKQYCPRSQNASDIAADMALFVARGNDLQNAYIVGFPNWVDSRAVGVLIGDINFPNTIGAAIGSRPVDTVELNGQPGWFALATSDVDELTLLQTKYPQGVARVVYSPQCPNEKNFTVFETQP